MCYVRTGTAECKGIVRTIEGRFINEAWDKLSPPKAAKLSQPGRVTFPLSMSTRSSMARASLDVMYLRGIGDVMKWFRGAGKTRSCLSKPLRTTPGFHPTSRQSGGTILSLLSGQPKTTHIGLTIQNMGSVPKQGRPSCSNKTHVRRGGRGRPIYSEGRIRHSTQAKDCLEEWLLHGPANHYHGLNWCNFPGIYSNEQRQHASCDTIPGTHAGYVPGVIAASLFYVHSTLLMCSIRKPDGISLSTCCRHFSHF